MDMKTKISQQVMGKKLDAMAKDQQMMKKIRVKKGSMHQNRIPGAGLHFRGARCYLLTLGDCFFESLVLVKI